MTVHEASDVRKLCSDSVDMRLLALVSGRPGPDCLIQLKGLHAVVERSGDEIGAYLVSSAGPALVPMEVLTQDDQRVRLPGLAE